MTDGPSNAVVSALTVSVLDLVNAADEVTFAEMMELPSTHGDDCISCHCP